MQKIYINVYFKVYETSDGLSIRLPTLYEELNSPTSPDFPDHARNFSQTKLTCNSVNVTSTLNTHLLETEIMNNFVIHCNFRVTRTFQCLYSQCARYNITSIQFCIREKPTLNKYSPN